MSKRVHFDEKNLEDQAHKFPKYDEDTNPNFQLKYKQEEKSAKLQRISEPRLDNSLDSDEEEEDKALGFEKLKEDDVEGAEDDYAGEEVGITPFNLKEEMEEGDFDMQGNYHFKKEKVIRDEWLDNIDWMKVKKRTENEEMEDAWDAEAGKNPDFNELDVLKKMVELMQPGETVTKALRRLGGKQSKKSRPKKREWKKEKIYDLEAQDDAGESAGKSAEDEEKKQKGLLLQLTGLADEMMGAGHYDVYVDTYEKFQFKVKSLEAEKKAKEPQIPEDADDDDALDILASNIDKSDKGSESNDTKVTGETSESGIEESSIKWEYRWSEEDEEVHGPFTSQEMADWQEQGYFNDSVLVRRTDRDGGQFYSSKRIDFDLYT